MGGTAIYNAPALQGFFLYKVKFNIGENNMEILNNGVKKNL